MMTNTEEIPLRLDNASCLLEAQMAYQKGISDWQLWYRKQLIMFGAGPKKEVNSVTQLMNEVAEGLALHYGKSLSDIKMKSQKPDAVLIRNCIFYTLIIKYEFSRLSVGRCFGKDHSTIIHGLAKVEDWIKTPYRFQKEVRYLKIIYPEKFE